MFHVMAKKQKINHFILFYLINYTFIHFIIFIYLFI